MKRLALLSVLFMLSSVVVRSQVQNASALDVTGDVGTLNAANATAQVILNGMASCGAIINSGTLAATVVAEVSYDDGTTWVSALMYLQATSALVSSLVFTNPNPVQSVTIVLPGGTTNARLRVSSYTSGSTTATLQAVAQPAGVLQSFGPPGSIVTAAWTSATTLNTALTIPVTGYSTVAVVLNQGSTITGGAVFFEGSDASANWYPLNAALPNAIGGVPSNATVVQYALQQSVNQAFMVNVSGFSNFRLRLSVVISGTGTVNVSLLANSMAAATYIAGGALSASAVGTLTNNLTAPTNNNLGVLSALANAAAPTFTEGDQTLLSVDLNGRIRIIGTKGNNASAPGTVNLGVLPAQANAAPQSWTEGNNVVASVDLAGNLRTTTGAAQINALKNTQTTGAANTAVTTSIAAVANQKVHLYSVDARCSAGTSSLTVKDGVGGTTIWSTGATEVSTTTFTRQFTWPESSTAGNGMDVVLAACGASNTGTLIVHASQF